MHHSYQSAVHHISARLTVVLICSIRLIALHTLRYDARKFKTITITFRGTRNNENNPTEDWHFNNKVFCKEMKTPDLIRDKMDEPLKEHVLVHEGFKSEFYKSYFTHLYYTSGNG